MRAGLVAAGIAAAATVTLAQPASAGGGFPTHRGNYSSEFNCIDAGESGKWAGKWKSYSCHHVNRVWLAWELWAA